MALAQTNENEGKVRVRVPEWVYYFTDDQFILWCKQRKLTVCSEPREVPEDERAAIFRYMVRQNLVN